MLEHSFEPLSKEKELAASFDDEEKQNYLPLAYLIPDRTMESV